MLKNYVRENIQPCSYDFRLGELWKHKKGGVIDLSRDKLPALVALKLPYQLKPGEYVIGKSIEELDTPLDVMCFYAAKSTAFRIGLNILYGINDPGYKGKAIIGIYNISQNTIILKKGMSFLQAVFVTLKGQPIALQTKYFGGKIL